MPLVLKLIFLVVFWVILCLTSCEKCCINFCYIFNQVDCECKSYSEEHFIGVEKVDGNNFEETTV